MLSLQGNPRPQDYAALKGYQGNYRIDQGDYRILYTIDDDNKLVDILRVGKRNNDKVYPNL
ncbi:type II toxin-antitoxin system RelE family toxin [Trichormus azollae]|uniref:type II toxin-antitoxin system RelE family toxin n=1 Tax=Trichormus azollae TaxID=1164 RepID=UPI001E3BE963|nr:type II toxin-antitoxin system RelE/ParE family toxin [Trichormus azollae]